MITRLLTVIFVLLGFATFATDFGSWIRGLEIYILFFQAIICSITTGVIAFSAFDIESKKEFVLDVVVDVIFLIIPIVSLTIVVVLALVLDNYVYWFPFVVFLITILFTGADFIISLNGGGGKLLEMDKQRFATSK